MVSSVVICSVAAESVAQSASYLNYRVEYGISLPMYHLCRTQVDDSLVLIEEGRKPRLVFVTKVTQQSSNYSGAICVDEHKFSKDGVEKYDGRGQIRVPTQKELALLKKMVT